MTYLNPDTKIAEHAAVTTNVHGTGVGNVVVGDDELLATNTQLIALFDTFDFVKSIGNDNDITSSNIGSYGSAAGTWEADDILLPNAGNNIIINRTDTLNNYVGITGNNAGAGTVTITSEGEVSTLEAGLAWGGSELEKIYLLPYSATGVKIQADDGGNSSRVYDIRYFRR